MKKIRQYKPNELDKFCDACIASGSTGMDIVRCLWQEIQELKQDLASYKEVYDGVKEQKNG